MGKKRLHLEFSEEFDEVLEELKQTFEKRSKVEVIRTAVTLLKFASDQKKEGRHLAITKDGEIEREIIVT